MRTPQEEEIARKLGNGEPLTPTEAVQCANKAREYRPEHRISANMLCASLRIVAEHHENHLDGWAGAGAVIDAAARVNSCLSKLHDIDPRAVRLALEAISALWQIDDIEPVKCLRQDSQNAIRRRSVELNANARRADRAWDYMIPKDAFTTTQWSDND